MTDARRRRPDRFRRIIYIFTPFALLLLLFAGLNWNMLSVSRSAPTASQRPQVATAVPGEPNSSGESAVPAATDVPPTATAVPLPTLPPNATIELVGPPADSTFAAESEIVFFWTWPAPLPEAYRFELQIASDGGTTSILAGNEPNLGLGYRAALPAGSLAAGSYAWSIRIVQGEGSDALQESESRPLTLTAGSAN